MDKFGTNFQSFEGVNDGSSLRNSRLVGLFFGAQWCDPCQRFLPNLSIISFYEQINIEIHQLEIIYFGMDNKQSAFDDFTRDMPWLYYDWKDQLKYKLYQDYKNQIKGIPCLIILNPNNSTIVNLEGRASVEKDGLNAFDKWLTQMSFK